MISITDALVAEHRVFTKLFDEIDSLLPKLTAIAEVRLLTSLVERLLHGHAETETNLAYVALDHALKERGHLDRLHEDHEEIDASLAAARTAPGFEEARRLLRRAIAASRDHFAREEQSVFPLLERTLRRETLTVLGAALLGPQPVPAE